MSFAGIRSNEAVLPSTSLHANNIFLSIREVYLGVLRGYGNTRMPMLLSLIGMMGLRQVFLAVSMRLRPGLFNIYICCPLAWGTTAAMIAAYYLLTRRRYEPDGQNV